MAHPVMDKNWVRTAPMIQSRPTTMAATLKASAQGLDLVDQARCKKGWAKQSEVWADLAYTSKATLRRFWAGVAIQRDTFVAICKEVGIPDWESVVDVEETEKPDKAHKGRLSFAIAGSIEDIDKHKLDAIVALLRKIGGDIDIEILDIDEGSIKLILGGPPEALHLIEALFNSGELNQVEGIQVEDVHQVSQQELVKLLHKNGGSVLNLTAANLSSVDLSSVDFSSVDLIGANLSRANLSRANLSEADLIIAKLIEANLSRADLSRANLIGADLSRADLSEADLNEADLSRANLIGADFSKAYVQNARFSDAEGILPETKADLISRGAIFEDDPNAPLRPPIYSR